MAIWCEDIGHFNRCKGHGGAKKVSPARMKTGTRTQQPKKSLKEFIDQAQENPELINLDKSIAIQWGIVESLLAKYEDDDSDKTLRELVKCNKTLLDLQKTKREIEEGNVLTIRYDQLDILIRGIVSCISRNLAAYPELLTPIIREIENETYIVGAPKAITA